MARMITGIVSSKKTNRTIVVTEQVRLTHPLYRKQYTVTKRFMAHDEDNEANEGDTVIIVESRPMSARKHFTLKSVVQKAKVQHVESENALAEYVDTKKDEPAESPKKAEPKTTEKSDKADEKADKKPEVKAAETAKDKQVIGFVGPEAEDSKK